MKQLLKKWNALHDQERHYKNNPEALLKIKTQREEVSQRIKDLRKRRREGIVESHAQTKGRAVEIFNDAQTRLTEAFLSVAKLSDDVIAELGKDEEQEEE